MTTAHNPADTPIDVTVVIPTYRREVEVCEALQSVLQQEGVTVEYIVLDDTPEGSKRAAVTALGDPRIEYRPLQFLAKILPYDFVRCIPLGIR